MNVSKAIIPVAGWGTRRLPITKVIEKTMLPIGNRPIIDYVVQDCIQAGIKDIYFIVSQPDTQLEAYYSRNQELEAYLTEHGKDAFLAAVRPPENVHFHYVVQPTSVGQKYGTAIPVALCESFVQDDESVAVLMGDDFIFNTDQSSELARLLQATPEGASSMLGVTIPREAVSRYGVIDLDDDSNFLRIVEKPSVDEAPSNLINPSKYVISPQLFKEICQYSRQEKAGEYYITDPINTYVQAAGIMKVVQAQGVFLDGGTVEGWLAANNYVMQSENSHR